jgi:hypothetical protein
LAARFCSQSGENVNGLIGQADALGAYYCIATQSSESGAYPSLGTNSAIIAVASTTPTPEPTTVTLIGIGTGVLGLIRKRRQKNGNCWHARAEKGLLQRALFSALPAIASKL